LVFNAIANIKLHLAFGTGNMVYLGPIYKSEEIEWNKITSSLLHIVRGMNVKAMGLPASPLENATDQ